MSSGLLKMLSTKYSLRRSWFSIQGVEAKLGIFLDNNKWHLYKTRLILIKKIQN